MTNDLSPGTRSYYKRMISKYGPLNPYFCPDCGRKVIRTTYRDIYCRKQDNDECWRKRNRHNRSVFLKNNPGYYSKKESHVDGICDRHVYVKGKCIVCDKIK